MRNRRIILWTIVALALIAAAAAIVAVTVTGRDSAGAANVPSGVAASDAQTASPSPAAPSSATVGTAAARLGAVPSVRLRVVARGLSQPLYVTAPPGDTSRLFIVEKTGRIRIVKSGRLLSAPFLDIHSRVSTGSEQGLLSMAFDPRFASNRFFYVDYTNLAGDTRVVRYRASASHPNRAVASSAKVLLKVNQPFANHNGGQLQFGPDGRLYIGLGDGGSEGDPNDNGQNLRTRLAKILTLNVRVAGAAPRMYAYGLRNPWRFSFDRAKGNLWIGDVGQNNWEEIDYLRRGTKAGTNFGWSYYEGSHVYKPQPIDRSRLNFPVAQYSHTLGCAVIGGYVYRGSAIPALRGHYLFGDECSGRIWFKTGPSAAKLILTGVSRKVSRLSSFGQGANGELYLTSLSGAVYRIVK